MSALDDLHDALDRVGTRPGRPTSAHLDPALTEAAKAAVALGLADSVSALTSEALYRELRRLAMGETLEEYFEEFPQDRPSVAEVALYLARARGLPMTAHPDLPGLLQTVAAVLGEDTHPEDLLVATKAYHALTDGSAA